MAKNAFGMEADKGLKLIGNVDHDLLAKLLAKYGAHVAENEFQKLDPAPVAKSPVKYTGSRKTGDGRINPDPNAWKKSQAKPVARIPYKPKGNMAAEEAMKSEDPMAVFDYNRAHMNPDEKIMQSKTGMLKEMSMADSDHGSLSYLPFQIPVKKKFTAPKKG